MSRYPDIAPGGPIAYNERMARYMVTRVQSDWVDAESESEAIETMREVGFGGSDDWFADLVEDSNGE